MKKLFLAVLITVALSVTAHAKDPMVHDQSVPLEQSSTLKIMDCQINNFDGSSVSWGLLSGGGFVLGREEQVVIPAGKHNLGLIRVTDSGRQRNETTASVTYEFIPGHSYYITLTNNRGLIIDETGLNIELTPDIDRPNASRLEGKWLDNKGVEELIFAGDEFILKSKGKPKYRGFFTLNGNNIVCHPIATYSKNTFKISTGLLWGNVRLRFTFDGTNVYFSKKPFSRTE